MLAARISGMDVAVVGAAIVITQGGRVIRTATTSIQRMRRHPLQQALMMEDENTLVTVAIADDVARSSIDLNDRLQLLCLRMMSGIRAKQAQFSVRQRTQQAPTPADIAITARVLSREINLCDTREVTIRPLAKRKKTMATSQDMTTLREEETQPTTSPSHHLPLQHPMAWACHLVHQVVHSSLHM